MAEQFPQQKYTVVDDVTMDEPAANPGTGSG